MANEPTDNQQTRQFILKRIDSVAQLEALALSADTYGVIVLMAIFAAMITLPLLKIPFRLHGPIVHKRLTAVHIRRFLAFVSCLCGIATAKQVTDNDPNPKGG